MRIDDLEHYLTGVGHKLERLEAPDQQVYLVVRDIRIAGGILDGKTCDVAVLRTAEDLWVPQAALHVRPALLPMGQHNTQASPVGPEWQYWSRRFDRVPTPRSFFAHILTCLGSA
jgi:hypothetical protein